MTMSKTSLTGQILMMAVAMASMTSATGVRAADSVKETFNWYCAQCHGENGTGTGVNSVPELPVGPMDLTNPKEMARYPGEKIIKTLTQGGPVNTLDALMPPWGNRFTASELEALKDYVLSLCTDPACVK